MVTILSLRAVSRITRSGAAATFIKRGYSAKTGLASENDTLKSSCSENTVLEGLAYLKDQPPVLAKPDSEYPSWLWELLQPKQVSAPTKSSPKDTKNIKTAKKSEKPAPPVGDSVAQKALRNANRKAIKNSNFMKAS